MLLALIGRAVGSVVEVTATASATVTSTATNTVSVHAGSTVTNTVSVVNGSTVTVSTSTADILANIMNVVNASTVTNTVGSTVTNTVSAGSTVTNTATVSTGSTVTNTVNVGSTVTNTATVNAGSTVTNTVNAGSIVTNTVSAANAQGVASNWTSATSSTSSANAIDDVVTLVTTTIVPCTSEPTNAALAKSSAVPSVPVVQSFEEIKRGMDQQKMQLEEQKRASEVNLQRQIDHIEESRQFQQSQIQKQQITGYDMSTADSFGQSITDGNFAQTLVNTTTSWMEQNCSLDVMERIEEWKDEQAESLLQSAGFQQLIEQHRDDVMEFVKGNENLEWVAEQVEATQMWQEMSVVAQEASRWFNTSVEGLLKKQLQQQALDQQQQMQQVQVQEVQKQMQQQEQQQTIVQTQQEESSLVQEESSSWNRMHKDALQTIINTLSLTGTKGSTCKALAIQSSTGYEVRDVVNALLTGGTPESPLDYRLAVQNVFNKLYHTVCLREYYERYKSDLVRWNRDGGWVRSPPPLPPSKVCPPPKIAAFASTSPPWLNRLPAWIRAKYYDGASLFSSQVQVDGKTGARLKDLAQRGLIDEAEFAYMMALKRANDRIALTGTDGPLPRLVGILAGYNPDLPPKASPLVFVRLMPRVGRLNSTTFLDTILTP